MYTFGSGSGDFNQLDIVDELYVNAADDTLGDVLVNPASLGPSKIPAWVVFLAVAGAGFWAFTNYTMKGRQ